MTSGRGESEPKVSNATRAGRAQNRRVELELVLKDIAP
jgi:OOP family OmpA-OmpF porin